MWPQLMVMVWLLWPHNCGRMGTLELFVIFWEPQSLRSFKCLLFHSILLSIIPKTRDDSLPLKKEYFRFNMVSFCLTKASVSFHFLPALFDFWAEKWRNAVLECFCRGRGPQCARGPQDAVGRVSTEHLTRLLTAPQGVFFNMSTLQAPSPTL